MHTQINGVITSYSIHYTKLYDLGKTYYRLKEYSKAIDAFRESEKIASERKLTGGLQYLYEALAMPYYDIGDYKNAYNTYIRYMTIRDSVYNVV